MARTRIVPLALAALLGAGFAAPDGCARRHAVRADLEVRPGFVEPHTPGAGGALEIPASPAVETLLGPEPDLNRSSTLRFRPARFAPRPRGVLILVPGFLGGASSLAPLAEDLVRALHPWLEVWVVDRRPNQLEDRLGIEHARGAFSTGGPPDRRRIDEGLLFYSPGSDLDDDGVPDAPVALRDRLGVERGQVRFAQDDLRFMAHWGVDTYVRDWKLLVDEARHRVGRRGLVLIGGHSMGTTWSGVFAAYDFDPGPGVDAGHEHLDGLVLIEGGGPGEASPSAPDPLGYVERVEALEEQGEVFLESLGSFLPIPELGAASELAALLGQRLPDEPSPIRRTSFGQSLALTILLSFPVTNRAALAFFVDDDFQPFAAFRASVGFSVDGPNERSGGLFGGPPFYLAQGSPDRMPRRWLEYDDPSLPTCPPAEVAVSPGCAIQAGQREVTDLDTVLRVQSGPTNFVEWYFVSGRVNLDLSYGRDSGDLGDDRLLAVTQNARVDLPVLAIGGGNGLTPTPDSFADYLGSIATAPEEQEIVILDGYAHLDPVLATDNEAVPVIADWMRRVYAEKRGRRCLPPGLFGRFHPRACGR